MPTHKNRSNKDSSEKNDKPSRKDTLGSGSRSRPASQLQRRRKGRADDDDESVDSRGNIRDLIVSTEDEAHLLLLVEFDVLPATDDLSHLRGSLRQCTRRIEHVVEVERGVSQSEPTD